MNSLLTVFKKQTLAAGLLALLAASAQAGSVGTTYPVTLGNSYIGAKETYGVTVQNGSTLASYSANATVQGTFLGTAGNVTSASITEKLSGTTPSLSATLTVGGFTVLSSTSSAASTSFKGSTSQSFVNGNTTVSISTGGVTYPVALKGTLSGTGSINVTATANTAAHSVAVSGSVGDTAAGAATASVSPSTGATASVTGNLNLGASTLNTNTTVSFTSYSGTTSLALDPLNLLLNVVLTSNKSNATLSTATLASFVAAARTFTLLSL